MIAQEMFGTIPRAPRFVLRCSYGNDSIALIQWAHEQGLRDVVVLYSDTGWAADWWSDRVAQLEYWVHGLGFWTDRTKSIGMPALIREKKAWPQRLMQFCTLELKIKPAQEWFAKNDPEARAIVLTGVRRAESAHRRHTTHFMVNSPNDQGRTVIRPMVEWSDSVRDEFLGRAGVKPLPHRSRECRCINSNKGDIRSFTANDVSEIEALEKELGFSSNLKPKTMFRPSKCMGAVGIREVLKWAESPHGRYIPPSGKAIEPDDLDKLAEIQPAGCDDDWCGI